LLKLQEVNFSHGIAENITVITEFPLFTEHTFLK